ncbi:MAG: MFS transporter [Chloroflexi bacterium]|nr:MFS transporter [Chloroflexota bacterium]
MTGSTARWVILLILCGALGLHNGSRIGPAPLIDELRTRYGVDYAGAGNVIGAYTVTYAFSQLSAGLLTDRFGSRRLLLVGLALMAAGSGIFAVAVNYTLALSGRLLMGIAGGFLYTPSLAYCFGAFSRAERGRAMGIAQTGIGVGMVLSITLLPLIFTLSSLTVAFSSYPILALVLLGAVWWLLPPVEVERKPAGGGIGALARQRDFWMLLVGFSFLGLLAQSAVMSWMPTYLRSDFAFSVVQAGFAGGLVAFGLMVFPAPFGVLADRLKSRRAMMLFGCGLGLVGYVVLLVTTNAYVAIAASLLVGASMAATIPMQSVYATERFAAVGAGTAIGVVNSGGQIAQALATPAYGAMLDAGLGFTTVWATTVVLGLIRIGAVLLLREPHADDARVSVPHRVPAR